ncbi:hypothetical protein HPB50_018821 [Hyalomma asiaticum]|uniref:Uncharacterized protein n=1 Tax=Hyalomma asiaticum TaxID=266040 RepID=A0ACB7RUA9_HYAAI|nr:hypothetical protein HPB50_018821 [Hyalomma asiaticum]
MGLSDAEFFWGHFLTCLIIGIVESVIVVILMTTFEYHGTTYAHGIDASLLTVSFIVFQIGLCLMIILITWVFPKGMLAPTSGKATVCGFDVARQRGQVRQRVSFCQQTDIFFDDMTCVENLLYFGSLKGARQRRLHNSAVETVRVVGLEDKVNSMPNQLSGGMKRRLSIAMTLVSEPDLLILDEPTAGMDPETRRNIWDTLQKVAKQRTLLLSSHDMEEADAIADQIIVMSSGSVVCSGSTAFLKKACGVGYKLTFAKVPKAFDLANVMGIVHKSVPQAVVEDENLEAVSVALGTMENTHFPGMFKALETSMARLGISGIGVTVLQ